jgi:hydrogenase maturation protease
MDDLDDEAARLARAVLYEGYLLWPYRLSALKNRQRWTIGGVHPEPYGRAREGYAWRSRTQCLLEADAAATVTVRVRWLHVVTCEADPVQEGFPREEAVEREVAACGLRVAALLREPHRVEIDVPAGREPGGGGVVRGWEALRGRVEVAAEPLRPGLVRLTVRVVNTTAWCGEERAEAMRRTLVAAHTVLRAGGGGFVSLMDPPEELRGFAEGCRNVGGWPVLLGAEGDRRAMLSAPIILYDHPRIAPQSPGDLFDATEIDQLLTLSVLALSEREQREIREGDPRGREILERCAALSPEQLMRLHGIVRAEPAS